MNSEPLPIVILGGSDRRPGTLPDEGRDKHPLSGYKAIDLRIGGRPLLARLIDSLRACGEFSPLYLAGPVEVHREAGSAAIHIDTDGTFGANIRASTETVRADHPGRPFAFVTCDVLPEVRLLQTLMAGYRRRAPCDMWFPMVRAPEDAERLGASAWKPEYRIVPEPGLPAIPVLPGHLVVVDPEALRLRFLYGLFQMGYETRNRSIGFRLGVMLRRLCLGLLWQDVRHLAALRLPTLSWDVLGVGIPAAVRLRKGTITRAELEGALRRMFVLRRHRDRFPHRRICLPIAEGLSLALDIDTEEEALERGADLAGNSV